MTTYSNNSWFSDECWYSRSNHKNQAKKCFIFMNKIFRNTYFCSFTGARYMVKSEHEMVATQVTTIKTKHFCVRWLWNNPPSNFFFLFCFVVLVVSPLVLLLHYIYCGVLKLNNSYVWFGYNLSFISLLFVECELNAKTTFLVVNFKMMQKLGLFSQI